MPDDPTEQYVAKIDFLASSILDTVKNATDSDFIGSCALASALVQFLAGSGGNGIRMAKALSSDLEAAVRDSKTKLDAGEDGEPYTTWLTRQ